MPYAQHTKVPITKTRGELEALVKKHGAQGFATAWDQHGDRIEFLWKGLRVRFMLPRAKALNEQADRRRWRALLLVVKAKLEAIGSGIAIFEEEFLSYIVDEATDTTVGTVLVPRIRAADGHARALLTGEVPR
jgi:hypothetical protein